MNKQNNDGWTINSDSVYCVTGTAKKNRFQKRLIMTHLSIFRGLCVNTSEKLKRPEQN